MANKKPKTQAEQAASSAKKKASAKQSNTSNKKTTPKNEVKERQVPVRVITSLVFLGLFVLFLVIFFAPEGAILTLIANIYQGLFGRAVLLVSIPGFLYLFIIHAFSGKRPVVMRSVCLFVFMIITGCIAHLTLAPTNLSGTIGIVKDLYEGGIAGESAGLICGLITMLVHWLCGSVISYIVFIVGAVLTLLGAMQITIPSIVRAIQDRPRAEWEDEEPEPRQEPAAVVVNHIATKRIEYLENQRLKADAARTAQEAAAQNDKKPEESRVSQIMRQIDGDVEAPVSASAGESKPNDDEILTVSVSKEPVPETMPQLEIVNEQPSKENVAHVEEVPKTPIQEEKPKAKRSKKLTPEETEESAAEVAAEIAEAEAEVKPAYCFPPIDLLRPAARSLSNGTAEMRENTRRLNETLASFKIEAKIINVTRGPSVTRYEVELEKGVRLNKLTTAADDIALSLGATGVRIAAVPGKISVVGIEVPNRAVTTVSLREVIDSNEFATAKSKSTFAVGKDIGGSCIVGNIAKLPHMLIAGTTGSGKSVCMNSIIISLLYKASPDDVKLIMVDPKMVELGIYNGIPHLLIPVVTDPKKAAGSLQWAVSEMMRRYKAMSDAGVRDLESYNSIMETHEESGKKLPQIVVIIDELADLMLVAAKEVEESICRIAQMGRAAGIHLVIATQRPSADVITGLMKANIPSRIAFAVASAMESRIILDTQGAEKLVGKGDMLYAPIGNGKPQRVQGCFVSDPEVEAVATYVKSNFITNYDQQVMEEIERKAVQNDTKASASDPELNQDEIGRDELVDDAVEVILDTKQASVSMLQRRLKLGYARAARIMDEMEELGYVGPFQGSKPREILITRERWESEKIGSNSQLAFEDLEEHDEVFGEEDE